ncbi:hypothetical protein EDD85DRAFT_962964 [Armillaria nabsnona]|nr:hypothetical protein EDD85DRAFT_962964 [Armillaria nabsnona]
MNLYHDHLEGTNAVSFHLFTTQYHQVFSVSGPAGDDNEWGIEMIWLKWLLLSFKLQGSDASMSRPPSFDPRRYKHGRCSSKAFIDSGDLNKLTTTTALQSFLIKLCYALDTEGQWGTWKGGLVRAHRSALKNYTKLAFDSHQIDLETLAPTLQRPMDSPSSVASDSDGDTNLIVPSETGSDSSEDGEPVLEATADSSGTVHPEVTSASPVAGPQIYPVEEESNSDSDTDFNYIINDESFCDRYRRKWGITLPEVTLSALTESGQAESSIEVPLQWSYTGRSPVISSSLADTPCATLGIQGILDQLNTTLGTSHTLDTPSLSSLLNDCIEKNDDFGTAYAHLRPVWKTDGKSDMRNELSRYEEKDKEQREKALVGNQIICPRLQPRRVWDLYSNRVIPSWIIDQLSLSWCSYDTTKLLPISHAWVDEKDHVDVWTSINGREWPVPIPKGSSLELIRIEMLNMGVEYTWLDVLCLRQKGGLQENLRVEEWKLDVPTIGEVYDDAKVVIYLSGLGQPLSLKDGDLDSDQCWFRRAWTVQEVGRWNKIIAGDTPDGPMHARIIDKEGNYETDLLTRFHKQLKSVQEGRGLFGRLAEMQKRVSTNPVDRVAGLAFPLYSSTIPAYHESESLEDAWTALVDAMEPVMRADFLFGYSEAGLGCKKWRPTWKQVMTEPLPDYASYYDDDVKYNKETGEDWYEGYCIEKGLVQGLDVGSAEGCDRCGELVVKDANGIAHTFKIHVTHQCLIPEDVYILLGDLLQQTWAVGRRLPGQKFKKVSVFMIDSLKEIQRLKDLDVSPMSHNVLV